MFVCDGIIDCDTNSDEIHCSEFEYAFFPMPLCLLVFDTNLIDFGAQCPRLSNASRNNCSNSYGKPSPLTLDFVGLSDSIKIKNLEKVHNEQIKTSKHCLFDPSDCEYLNMQSNGEHLISCENHTCHSKYYKCPTFYCLPWRFVCNDQWDCPGGTDEMHCEQKSCPGMFKCRYSKICISAHTLCDSQSDCHFNDDEAFCSRSSDLQSCPDYCSCLLFSTHCESVPLETVENLKPYIMITLIQISTVPEFNILNLFENPVVLALRRSKLSSVCNAAKSFTNILSLDISINQIESIGRACFIGMVNMRRLILSRNDIFDLKSFAFSNLTHMAELDLSWNDISKLRENVFSGLIGLNSIDLTGNHILSISKHTFSNAHTRTIVTDTFRVCCARNSIETFCFAEVDQLEACGRLLSIVQRVFIIFISGVGGLFNLASIFILLRKILPSVEKYDIVIMCQSVSDLLYGISLLIIFSADNIFSDNYLEHEYYWRSNFFCFISCIFSLFSQFLSLFTVQLLTLTRYLVVKYPLDSKFRDKNFLKQLCFIASGLIFLFTLLSFLSHIFTVPNYQLYTGHCLLLGYIKYSIPSLIGTIIRFFVLSVSSIAIPFLYYLIVQAVNQSMAASQQPSKSRRSKGISKSMIASFANLVSFVPSSALMFLILVWNEYPHTIIVWTLYVIIPLNTVINPTVFVFFNFIRQDRTS